MCKIIKLALSKNNRINFDVSFCNSSTSIDNNEITIGIFVDLAKAFDTVNHDILLSKLYHYGIRGTAYQWFKSYLINRHQ